MVYCGSQTASLLLGGYKSLEATLVPVASLSPNVFLPAGLKNDARGQSVHGDKHGDGEKEADSALHKHVPPLL